MKKSNTVFGQLTLLCLIVISFQVQAQNQDMQYFRYNDKNGLNVFETSKNDTTPFHHIKIKVGGNFEQSFQMLRDQNTAVYMTQPGFNGNVNSLIPLTNGFDLAMANLVFDAPLADGIRVNLTVYLASRHHEDTWV